MVDRLSLGQSLLIAALAMGGAAPAAGQSALNDPMRPPSALDAAPAASGPAAKPAANGLQTIILHRKGKPIAVINGVSVELGGKIGEARLVKLSDSEAVLQGPQGREVLRLTPAAGKKTPAADPPKPAPRANQ